MKKFEEFANFLQTAPINTFVAVTETWLDTDCNIENNFLTASHTFFGKCRSYKTGASKGGGVGNFVTKNTDLSLAEWCRMYQCEKGNDMFDSFLDIFEKIVEKHAPSQSVKKGEKHIRMLRPG